MSNIHLKNSVLSISGLNTGQLQGDNELEMARFGLVPGKKSERE